MTEEEKKYKNRISLELLFLTSMSNENNRGNFRARKRELVRVVNELYYYYRYYYYDVRIGQPLEKYHLILTRFSSSQPDYDGLVSGFKPVVDALKVGKISKNLNGIGIIKDDKLSMSGVWDCRWEKCKKKEGKIKVIIEY